MADQSDVEVALVSTIADVLYPSGVVGYPPATVLGCPARVGRGWPDAVSLDQDLRASILDVTVYPRPGAERNTTRFTPQWTVTAGPQPQTLTLTAAGQAITVAGAQPSPFYFHNLAVVTAGGVFYAYKTQSTDTPTTIAAALAAEIPGATVAGPVITVPADFEIVALRVGTVGTISREVSRQERQFQIVVWAFNPDIRDAACKLIKPALDAIEFLSLADGSQARMYYALSVETDAPEKEILYRRDLIYCVEWASFQTDEVAQIVTTQVDLTATVPGAIDTIATDFPP